MGRKCSQCGNIGHNSRTCSLQIKEKHRKKFKLFGVQLENYNGTALSSSAMLKKSFSLDSLPPPPSSSASSTTTSSSSSHKLATGYLSDGLITKTHERKKGVAWSEEEHKVFLVGLEKLGKGDWRGISRKFVTTRTPTQVASHAQKYFLRLTTITKRKHRRPNLFHGARDKFSVQVVESSNSKSSNNKNLRASSSISFGIIPSSNSSSNPINEIGKSNAAHLGIMGLKNNQHHNSIVPILFGNNFDDEPFKFQSTINNSSTSNNHFDGTHHHQPPDLQLQLSLSTPIPKSVDQQVGPISVT